MTKAKQIKIRPIGEHIVVRRQKADERTPGGIVLPDQAQDKRCFGEVLATGTGHMLQDGTRVPLQVKDGEVIMFTKYAGFEQKDLGDDVIVIRESDVLGVVEQ
jgi:chaperonin GroES